MIAALRRPFSRPLTFRLPTFQPTGRHLWIVPGLAVAIAAGQVGDEHATGLVPLLLFSSPQDHVVDPAQGDYLAATWGGPVERVILERSYHVATQDYDKDLINERSVAFADQHTR